METTLKLTNKLQSLRKMFVMTTVPVNNQAFRNDLKSRIDAYNKGTLVEDPARERTERELKDEDKLVPTFNIFIAKGMMYANMNDNIE